MASSEHSQTRRDTTTAGPIAIRLHELEYELPPDRIAQVPCEPRDAARLLVLHRREGRIEHRTVRDVVEYLAPGDCLIVNRTKVMPAKFTLRRASGGRIDGLFLAEPRPGVWRCLLSGLRRLRPGESLRAETLPRFHTDNKSQETPRPAMGTPNGAAPLAEWHMTLIERPLEDASDPGAPRGSALLAVEPPDPAEDVLRHIGRAPLPPYIRRAASGLSRETEDALRDATDLARYQTVFADVPGAVAAPTAGLHFTPDLLERIAERGVRRADVVLHVGPGTFQPVEAEDLADHVMHREWFDIPAETVAAIESARAAGARAVAVGTTTVRVLEAAAAGGRLTARSGWTDLLIYPPYEFKAVDALMTNFHLPRSTLLALVCAFAGRDAILNAYREAIERSYRFFSYGDAMLIV